YVEILDNGEQVLKKMEELIKNAREYILLEEYIFRNDEVGKKFIELLKTKSKDGIKIYVVIDAIGTRNTDSKVYCSLLAEGINVRVYNPVFNWTILRIDYRNHRKVLVVDGNYGVVSGIGLGKEYKYWRDLGVYIVGDSIKDLEDSFWLSWKDAGWGIVYKNIHIPLLNEIKEKVENFIKPYKKPIERKNEIKVKNRTKVRIVSTYPFFGHYELLDNYIEIINNAKEYIYITNAYFVPNIYIRNALKSAVERGVNVKIILPGETDLPVIRRASRIFFSNLLKNGIELYELKGQVLHAKYIIADDIYVSIGSTNFLDRAFFMNYECNVDIIDKDIALQMKEIFLEDLKKSKEIKYSEWKKRNIFLKIKDLINITTLTLF
ncbi:MAG TPA: phosphatidylserine/phosphatidylglycerophosphate/cardiolipin synthase family protein, partial [bacterium]|nr:phosphatidylserine/phosphatidylglycerophosphate/cardiolipin synthase family protein [bacterium]